MASSFQARVQARLLATWGNRGALARALQPLAALYGVLAARDRTAGRARARKERRLPIPVIVVGNVIAGGAGKTPTTIAIAQHLQAQGHHPGIVSRGYGRKCRDVRLVRADSAPAEVGDEPLLIARRTGLPVAVGRNRSAAARTLLAHAPQTTVLLCDDGLQHLALARDIEICVFDERGIGNGWLLPSGPLREPWPRPVDLILFTGEPVPTLALPPGCSAHVATRSLAAVAQRADGRMQPLAQLAATPVAALAAIARPERFFSMLRAAGLTLAQEIALPDHADLTVALATLSHQHAIVCTEKDAVKLWRVRPDAWAVPLVLDIPAAFFSDLDARLATVMTMRASI